MSGVFTKRLGRMKSAVSCDTEVRNSSSSCLVFRQVKYEYDCWKPTIASACIIAGRVKSSARKTTSGSSAFTAAIRRSQNVRGFVRVVDAEDPHALLDPVPHDPQHLVEDALGIVVEVDRVDVLVLLRRVLGVPDGAVGELGEPVGMLGDPRVIGGGLQREVEGCPRCRAQARRTNARKSASVPRSGCTASWPPEAAPIAHGEPGSSGPGSSRALLGPLRFVTPISDLAW